MAIDGTLLVLVSYILATQKEERSSLTQNEKFWKSPRNYLTEIKLVLAVVNTQLE